MAHKKNKCCGGKGKPCAQCVKKVPKKPRKAAGKSCSAGLKRPVCGAGGCCPPSYSSHSTHTIPVYVGGGSSDRGSVLPVPSNPTALNSGGSGIYTLAGRGVVDDNGHELPLNYGSPFSFANRNMPSDLRTRIDGTYNGPLLTHISPGDTQSTSLPRRTALLTPRRVYGSVESSPTSVQGSTAADELTTPNSVRVRFDRDMRDIAAAAGTPNSTTRELHNVLVGDSQTPRTPLYQKPNTGSSDRQRVRVSTANTEVGAHNQPPRFTNTKSGATTTVGFGSGAPRFRENPPPVPPRRVPSLRSRVPPTELDFDSLS